MNESYTIRYVIIKGSDMRKGLNHRIIASGAALALALMWSEAALAQAGAPQTTTPPTPAADEQAEEDRPAVATPVVNPQDTADGGGADIIVTGSTIRGVAPIGSNLVRSAWRRSRRQRPSTSRNSSTPCPRSRPPARCRRARTPFLLFAADPQPGGIVLEHHAGDRRRLAPARRRHAVLADRSQHHPDQRDPAGRGARGRRIVGLWFGRGRGRGQFHHAAHFRRARGECPVRLRRQLPQFQINFIWGKKWETGGVYVAGSYSDASKLVNRDREFASRGDYRAVGGSVTPTASSAVRRRSSSPACRAYSPLPAPPPPSPTRQPMRRATTRSTRRCCPRSTAPTRMSRSPTTSPTSSP